VSVAKPSGSGTQAASAPELDLDVAPLAIQSVLSHPLELGEEYRISSAVSGSADRLNLNGWIVDGAAV